MESALQRAEHPAAPRRHRDRSGAGAGDHRRDRVPGPGSPQLRARRAGDADRARPQPPRRGRWTNCRASAVSARKAGCPPNGRCSSTASWPARPRSTSTPSAITPATSLDRRRHGARRRGRRPLRGLGLRDPTADVARLGRRRDQGVHDRDRASARRPRSHQRAVRSRRHDGLRDRGESSGQPDRTVRGQGEGGAAGEGRDPCDARRDARANSGAKDCSPSRSAGTCAVKEAVLPFNRFPEVDPALGPEMRSTGEVMGID